MLKPFITVLMPVYNCERFIQQAIESVLNQTYSNFEFLIIDDCSTDQTISFIKKYNDSRINFIEKPINSGYTISLNLGFKIAKGKYIARMDGDDICVPTRFEKQVLFLEENPDVIVCGSLSKILGTNTIMIVPENHEEIKLAMLKANCIIHPSVMIQKKSIDEFSIVYDTSKEPAEDYDLWVRLAILGSLYNLQEVLLHYRMYDEQVSNVRNENQKKIAKECRLKLLNHLPFAKMENEIIVLKKFIEYDVSIKFTEILLYHEKIKKSILQSNVNGFFEKKGLEDYLSYIEYETVKAYFLRRKKYNPSIFFNYLKIRSVVSLNFVFRDEFKLFLKSFNPLGVII
ncbi:glycosyltransferase family 2 protein [Flavobacterium sp.]|uniref:glycosyltransferase family 2 protein n=1 Tax=Flavobacterium sp. TaxID=239 RepID=UPI0025EB0A5E|nr:glycosyltransferase family 2 protein [Flavobacterium sp.]